MSLVVIVPTRGRAVRLRSLVNIFAEVTPEPYRILFVVDPDDNRSRRATKGMNLVTEDRFTFPRKVNLGIAATDEEFVLVAADDVRPHPGWFEAARQKTSEGFGFIATNDLGNKEVMAGRLATLPFVTRWYIHRGTVDGDGLYHEGYHHNGADREASETAQVRGAFAYAPDSIVEHLHPNYGKNGLDDTYREGGFHRAGNIADKELYCRRSHLWGR